MSRFRYDADAGRFRWDETIRNQDGEIQHRAGSFVDPNTVIRQGNVTRDDHGYRYEGKFIPEDSLKQSRRTRPSSVQPETDPARDSIRIVAVDPEGNVRLVRAAAHPSRNEEGDVVVPARLNQAKIVAANALDAGIITEGEYDDLTAGAGNDARDAIDLIKERAAIVQDPMDLPPSDKLRERARDNPNVRL